ncbi:hypothetical protein AB0J14_04890 [Micromonospora arborensis]|uniref:hypothetical protein n=1 Tax=Micromonospora arborensis TaxID=2116518 RepID=UPI0033D941F2
MFSLLGRAGLLICAVAILFLARRLHTKASGKAEKTQKVCATIAGFFGGLALIGTVAGEWMGKIGGASPYIAAAIFLVAAGGLLIDWWADGKPDKFAFWCAVVLPMAAIIGYAQLPKLGDAISDNAEQVSTTVESGRGK